MHNDDRRDPDNLARHVHNPHRDLHLVHNTLRDPVNNRMPMCNRDRNRRT